MANTSIFNAFERMWQHVVAALNNKSDKTDVEELQNLVGDTPVSEQISIAIGDVDTVPTCTTVDNGKFLRVVNGVATWSTVPNAEEASF